MKPVRLTKFVDDIRGIVHKYRTQAANSINISIIHERWEIGQRIVEEDQKGELRAEYGTKLLDVLSNELTFELGKGYTPRNLAYYIQVVIYRLPQLGDFAHACAKSYLVAYSHRPRREDRSRSQLVS